MDFEKFLKAVKDPELKKKALEGFDERQKRRESEFAEKAKKTEPTDAFYNRRYDI